MKKNAEACRVELRVVKDVEFKCGRSWVFTCRMKDPVPKKFFNESGEWEDSQALLVSPKMGIINDIEEGTLACLRYSQ